MLTTLALVLAVSQPIPSSEIATWQVARSDSADALSIGSDRPGEPRHEGLLEIDGRVGLTPWEAEELAFAELVDRIADDLERRLRREIASSGEVWLPGCLEERAIRRWRRGLDAEDLVDVVRNRLIEHEHAGFPSYQVEIAARPKVGGLELAESQFDRSLRSVQRRTTAFGLGTLGLWGLLGLGFVWFDRLTRGYMPWRTGLALGGMGVLLPVAAFFVI